MPGWHEATKELQDAGRVQMLGVIQEQNPDRCRLFMQWKQMDWPILVDTFDQLEVSVVPLTYAIDEHGVVRQAGLRLRDAETLEESFLSKSWPAPTAVAASPAEAPWQKIARQALAGELGAATATVDALAELVQERPEDGWAHFRLAAAHRLRYDSPERQAGDFQRAVDHWQRALEIDPNNYIWRRRIQQYGPRLSKPYPFYDWIETAREQVASRGEEPAPLVVEPTGSEIAAPSSGEGAGANEPVRNPDPNARVLQDGVGTSARLVEIETTVVPSAVGPGEVSRAHLVFRPNERLLAHWNNESEPLRLWIDAPSDWSIDSPQIVGRNAETAVSSETRRLEVELRAPADVEPATFDIPAYALYYVCEDENGTCLYRRQDVRITVEARAP
ncbi:MAG: hypothetical protein AAF690_24955 [Acidobacteriota bacterium]